MGSLGILYYPGPGDARDLVLELFLLIFDLLAWLTDVDSSLLELESCDLFCESDLRRMRQVGIFPNE